MAVHHFQGAWHIVAAAQLVTEASPHSAVEMLTTTGFTGVTEGLSATQLFSKLALEFPKL